MANTPPEYLHYINHCDKNGNFKPEPFTKDEFIYRCFSGNKTYPENEFFSEVKFEEGISVNRGMYSKNPTDVLWKNEHIPFDDKIASCNYNTRNGFVIFSIYHKLKESTPPPNFTLRIDSTWTKCNVSHCDIGVETTLPKITKPLKRDVRLFLASLFKELKVA